jgi:hypothetical protein
MSTHLSRTPLCTNKFFAGCDSMLIIIISDARIYLLFSGLGQLGNNSRRLFQAASGGEEKRAR